MEGRVSTSETALRSCCHQAKPGPTRTVRWEYVAVCQPTILQQLGNRDPNMGTWCSLQTYPGSVKQLQSCPDNTQTVVFSCSRQQKLLSCAILTLSCRFISSLALNSIATIWRLPFKENPSLQLSFVVWVNNLQLLWQSCFPRCSSCDQKARSNIHLECPAFTWCMMTGSKVWWGTREGQLKGSSARPRD